MTDDADPGEVNIVETAPAADAGADVIQGRAPRPPVRLLMRPSWLVGLLVAGLLAGIGIGYLVGHSDRGRPAAVPTPSMTLLTSGSAFPALTANTTCYGYAATNGDPLMVGVEVVNNSTRPVVLASLNASFPLGGLRQTGSQVGQCDNNATEPISGHRVEPSATVWLSLILDVEVRCPAPLPVQIELAYTVDGAPVDQTLNPFPDLGNVSYPGCATHSPH